MENCSTLVYIVDNLRKPSEEIINVSQFLDEIDTELDEIFGAVEINVPTSLVEKTLAKVEKEING